MKKTEQYIVFQPPRRSNLGRAYGTSVMVVDAESRRAAIDFAKLTAPEYFSDEERVMRTHNKVTAMRLRSLYVHIF